MIAQALCLDYFSMSHSLLKLHCYFLCGCVRVCEVHTYVDQLAAGQASDLEETSIRKIQGLS